MGRLEEEEEEEVKVQISEQKLESSHTRATANNLQTATPAPYF
jgi:hypothetical protein